MAQAIQYIPGQPGPAGMVGVQGPPGDVGGIEFCTPQNCRTLTSNMSQWGYKTIDAAIKHNHFECLKHLFENGCPVDCRNMVTLLDQRNNFNIMIFLEYMLKEGFPVRPALLLNKFKDMEMSESISQELEKYGHLIGNQRRFHKTKSAAMTAS